MNGRESAWDFTIRVTRPALLLAPRSYVDDIEARLSEAKIQEAVSRHDTATIFNWLVASISLQGISDAIALGFDARHGGGSIRRDQFSSARAANLPEAALLLAFRGLPLPKRRREMRRARASAILAPCRNIRFGRAC